MTSEFRDAIHPVAEDARPLWSVMIPTYHCQRYLETTLKSVLEQAPAQEIMQIEVVDDHSVEDDPESVVRQIGNGRVQFFRQPKNTGVTSNLTTCIQRARGRLVHILHGDDYVADGFYEKMQVGFEASPEIGFAFCRHYFVQEHKHAAPTTELSPLEQGTAGILPDHLSRLAVEQRIMTPSIVVRREAYERFGGFDHRLRCAEDWEMWIRIAANYPVWYEPNPLAYYRMHAAGNTGQNVQSGDDMEFTRQALHMIREYLPPADAAALHRKSCQIYSKTCLDAAENLLRQRDYRGARSQLKVAFRFSRSPQNVFALLRLIVRSLLFPARSKAAA